MAGTQRIRTGASAADTTFREIAMPYTWTCGECGAKLLSAAPDPPHQACPRCGNELPREPDELREEEDEG